MYTFTESFLKMTEILRTSVFRDFCNLKTSKFSITINQNINYVIESYRILRMLMLKDIPANIYLFKGNNRITRKRCQICSKLTLKTPE